MKVYAFFIVSVVKELQNGARRLRGTLWVKASARVSVSLSLSLSQRQGQESSGEGGRSGDALPETQNNHARQSH